MMRVHLSLIKVFWFFFSKKNCFLSFAILAVPACAADFQTVYRFKAGKDGGSPYAALYDQGGRLYGLAGASGARHQGGIFALDLATGHERVVHSFKRMAVGETPCPKLTLQSGALFGTTSAGGRFGSGTVFKLDLKTGAYKVVHDFNNDDGGFPQSGVIAVNGLLYGATQVGGTDRARAGTVFQLDPATGVETVLHSFSEDGRDGTSPNGLVFANGALYGTTEQGGPNNFGTLFKVDIASGNESVIYAFSGLDGAAPMAELSLHGGRLFGTTAYGGAAGAGTVFGFDPKSGELDVLYAFKGKRDGRYPFASVTYLNGAVYGATYAGGVVGGACDEGCGTVFRIDPASRKETVLHRFSGGQDGAGGYSDLTYAGGRLYGVTFQGDGTIFGLRP
jgi:uncharacterized repeat protein (TIGR03803 family)